MTKPVLPRVLIYDIETSPNLGYIWGKWQQDVIKYDKEWHMLCFAYKWLGEKETHVVALPDFEKAYAADKENDFYVVAALWRLFNEADVVIAHNGDSFDQKKAQARMLVHDLGPVVPYKQIDTKKVARRYFNFNSNKLEDLGNILGLGHKKQTGGFDLWMGCMAGDQKAWNKMKAYNKQDVVLLEKIYLRMRPWMQGHPAMNLAVGQQMACPKCGKGPMQRRGFQHTTNSNSYQRYQCQACGGWSRDRTPEKVISKVAFVN